jgi:hypothetical protein
MGPRSAIVLSCLSCLLVVAACGGKPSGAPCETEEDCEPGQDCVNGRCTAVTDGDGSVGPDGDGTGEPPCRELSADSTLQSSAVDIIIVVDNSGSMSEEAEQVRLNINAFADILAASSLDYRVVLISTPTGSRGVCVPPPLGSGAPDCVSGPEGLLRAVHVGVGSTNALVLTLSNYPAYADFLRPEAAKAFLWVTDDEANSTHSADSFRAALADLEPAGMFDVQIHNSIVGYYGDTPATWANTSAGSCATLAKVGATYMRLAGCYDNANQPIAGCIEGRTGKVCDTDWTDIFVSIAEGVVAGVAVNCEFAMPEPPDGQVINLDDIRVKYVRGDGSVEALAPVSGPGACTDTGWYFDDPAAPTEIRLCPGACQRVQGDPDARLEVELGCFPELG